jgi:hypothetical protein
MCKTTAIFWRTEARLSSRFIGTLSRGQVLSLILLTGNALTSQQDALPRIRTRHSGFGAWHLSQPGYPPSPRPLQF